MRKTFTLILVVVMSLTLVLAGCSSGNGNAGSSNQNQAPASTPDAEGATNQTNEQAEAPKETVTLKWGTWMGEEEAKQIIEAFEATHPHIKIETDPAVTWPWNEKLAAVAAAGQLPDVTWTFGVPVAAANGWLEDLAPYLAADPDFQAGNTFKNLDDTANYNGKQYALPHTLLMFGVFLNLDLFEKENIPVPPANWTVDDMREAAVALTKYNDNQFGMANLKGMRETLSSAFDPSLGWNTWDGEKFNFTSPAFKEAVTYIDELLYSDKVSLDIYKQEEKEQWYGKDKNPWMLGKIGMQYDGTWLINGSIQDAKFKWDIRPLPGDDGQRIPLITDYVGITKSSQHKEEAFEFVKWLTYSKEGWMERMKPEWPLGTIPLINDEEVWNAYLGREDMPAGMQDLIAMIPEGFADPIKWLPGYIDGLGIYHETFKQIDERQAKLEDVAPDLEKRMNDAYKTALDQLNAVQ
ncbi:ABC transporter substrate-binding protein [Paenibacillus abyssi]|uniref:Sugar ABC transporter substrate-binding protein n=2 Tax=Paenibacillus abyssi TaxID=1340531 RepID=A0A917FSJ4_9BACL|nr:sugar ABC transporter substrate-binding protein [Paenibacillus abyssi]GGF98102.1 sugar ABC transporter substrate-binding protein [Paenibacillus abyssi]